MKKYLELTTEISGNPILIDISSITLITPENKKCSRISFMGIDHTVSVRITYDDLLRKLTALGAFEVVKC